MAGLVNKGTVVVGMEYAQVCGSSVGSIGKRIVRNLGSHAYINMFVIWID